MDSCKLSLSFDLGKCAHQLAFGWIPDWVWTLLSWWPWILGAVVALILLFALAKVKEIAGWPGVFVVLTLGAYAVGRLQGNPFSRGPDPKEMFQEGDREARAPKRRRAGSSSSTQTVMPKGLPGTSLSGDH